MAQFVAMSAHAEVNGESVRSVILGMGAFQRRAVSILSAHGIDDPTPGQGIPSRVGWTPSGTSPTRSGRTSSTRSG